MAKVKLRFAGQLDGYKWRAGETIEMQSSTIAKLNPMGYTIRPEQPRRNTMQEPKQPVKREIKQNGSWWTLYEDGVKVKSARNKEDLQ